MRCIKMLVALASLTFLGGGSRADAQKAGKAPPKKAAAPSKFKSALPASYKSQVLALGCADAPDTKLIPCGVGKVRSRCTGLVASVWKGCSKQAQIEAARKAVSKCQDATKGQQLASMLAAMAQAQSKAGAATQACLSELQAKVADVINKATQQVKRVADGAKNVAAAKRAYEAAFAKHQGRIAKATIRMQQSKACVKSTAAKSSFDARVRGWRERARRCKAPAASTSAAVRLDGYQKASQCIATRERELDSDVAWEEAEIRRYNNELDKAAMKSCKLVPWTRTVGILAEELLEKAKKAIRSAFSTVYGWIKGKVKPALLRLLGNSDEPLEKLKAKLSGMLQNAINKALKGVQTTITAKVGGLLCGNPLVVAAISACGPVAPLCAGGCLALVGGLIGELKSAFTGWASSAIVSKVFSMTGLDGALSNGIARVRQAIQRW